MDVQPVPGDPTCRLRASVMRTETAPGAVEFEPPGGVWLPPERTFSPFGDGRSCRSASITWRPACAGLSVPS